METTNRKWQKHLRAKGIIPFFLDRLQQHALSAATQYSSGPFTFPIVDRETEDELSRAYFEFIEEFPYEFYIELTNHCNLNCTMCARPEMTRALGVMSMELWTKIIDEIAEKQPFAFIHYYGIGESMVDVSVFDKLDYAVSKGLHNGLLFTNGQLLTHNDNYKRLGEIGISNIGVDLDGFTPETYAKVRVGGDFVKVKEGIEKLYAHVRANNLRTRVEIAFQVVSGINEQDLGPFVAWCNANGYEYKLVTMHDWAGLRDDVGKTQVAGLTDMHHSVRTNPCPFLWNGLTISWDGKVAVCFHDADHRETFGDLNHESVEQVWVGAHRAKRRAHVAGRIEGVCASCKTGSAVSLPPFNSSLYPTCLMQDGE